MKARHGAVLALCLLLGTGCASVPEDQRVEHDPWEGMNRKLYRFNEVVDKVTLKPVAKAYRKVVPEPVRRGVSNFGNNLATPGSVINNFLQAKPERGFSELARFLLNSTFGIGGLFDVASAAGLEAHHEDFGQTAAVWGIPDGPYLMLPLMGPQTLRDAMSLPLNVQTDPLTHYENSSVRDPIWILRLVDVRTRILALEELMDDSQDPYVTLRESYLQNREFEIYDGDPPVDDDFYDDFLEDEDFE